MGPQKILYDTPAFFGTFILPYLQQQAIFIITGADVRHQSNLYCPAPEDGAK